MAMMLSVMVVGAGAAYKDGDKISAEYEVAVEVASQLGILEGFEDGSYGPQKTLTRAQLATMIYRITTGDVEDDYTANFAGGAAASFTDTPADQWYAGYIGYSADAGYLKGVGNDLYKPNSPLTGYQALAALLRGLGYNEKDHNFCGPDWTVQVAKVANETGIIDGIKGVDFNEAITREVAAQMIFNVLFTEMVDWTLAYGYDENGKFLAKEVFGIVNVDKDGTTAAGDFGRPSTEWYDKDKEALVSIPEAPLATYVEAVAGCDIIDDTGLEEDDVLDVYTNGVQGADITLPDTTAKDFGAQGRLTEVYEDVIVYIDTYLAEVEDVITEKVDSKNHVTREAAIELDVFKTGTTSYTFETKDFAEGDMVLVTIDAGEVATVVDADSSVGELSKIAGRDQFTRNIQKVEGIDGEAVTVNVTADYEPEMKLDVKYIFFYDTYGNVIGAEEIAAEFAVVDSIYRESSAGVSTISGTLVDFGANTEDVTFAGSGEVGRELYRDVVASAEANQAFYYTVFRQELNDDGNVVLSNAFFTEADWAEYRAGSPYMHVFDQDATLQLSDDSIILMQTKNSPNGEYTAYVGYESLPSFEGGEVQYTKDANGYVDMMYLVGVELTERTVFVYDVNPTSSAVTGNEGWFVAETKALELVDGELVDVTIDVMYPDFTSEDGVAVDRVGLYTLVESDEYGLYYAVEAHESYCVDNTNGTLDNFRVEIDGKFEKLDDAVIAQYVGSFTKGEVEEVEATTLNTESIVFLQRDEDNNVVAVYDMWVELDASFAGDYEGATLKAPALYMGKAMAGNIEVGVPAYMNLSQTTVNDVMGENDLNNSHFSYQGTASHDTAEKWAVSSTEKLWGDVVITLVADPAHTNTNLTAAPGQAYAAVDGNTVYVAISDQATFTFDQLKNCLVLDCDYASLTFLDNGGELLLDTVKDYEGKADLSILVTAENGDELEYRVVFMV